MIPYRRDMLFLCGVPVLGGLAFGRDVDHFKSYLAYALNTQSENMGNRNITH
jgi:hypothetical protein